ncbi:hypothetical protein [Chitinophaga sp. CF118]|uniref:hypothetical protein n=1 Tax=Chitinophaga sp. CF118 TaxID=1884367 RepID=UPI000B7F43EA|nr:hypothetical protein [Chitinophaga sp. CF118]
MEKYKLSYGFSFCISRIMRKTYERSYTGACKMVSTRFQDIIFSFFQAGSQIGVRLPGIDIGNL